MLCRCKQRRTKIDRPFKKKNKHEANASSFILVLFGGKVHDFVAKILCRRLLHSSYRIVPPSSPSCAPSLFLCMSLKRIQKRRRPCRADQNRPQSPLLFSTSASVRCFLSLSLSLSLSSSAANDVAIGGCDSSSPLSPSLPRHPLRFKSLQMQRE